MSSSYYPGGKIKSKADLKAAKDWWNNSARQQRDPAGYERHLAKVDAYNKSKGKGGGDKDTVKEPENSWDDLGDYTKYEDSEAAKQHNQILKISQSRVPTEINLTSRDSVKDQIEEGKEGRIELQGASIKKTGDNEYEVGRADAKKLKIDKGTYSREEIIAARQKYENQKYIDKHYSGDSSLPKRPKAPKMPTLKLPGGISKTKVDSPSGNGRKIYDYTAKGNYDYKKQQWNPAKAKNKVKNSDHKVIHKLGPDFKEAVGDNVKKTMDRVGQPYNKPTKTTQPKKAKTPDKPLTPRVVFGKDTTDYAPGVSIGKGDSNLYKPLAKKRIKNQIRKADSDNKISTNELAKIRGISNRNNVSQKFVDRNIAKHGENKYGTKFTDPKPTNPFGQETSNYAPGVSIRKKK